MNKSFALILSLLLLATAGLSSCEKGDNGNGKATEPEPKPAEVTGVELDNNTLTLTKGDTETLIATVEPEDATDFTIA